MPARRRPTAAAVYHVEGQGYHAWFARPAGGQALTSAVQTLPALREAEIALAAQARAVPRRPTRIPASAFVPVQTRLLAAPERPLELAAPTSAGTANDNATPEAQPRKRRILRELFFLVILFATIAIAFYGGRLHAANRVIIVPDASSYHSVVT